jgi:hypothetical protein
MTMYSAKSANGRTEWILNQGRLTEIGPYSPKLTMTATDTKILFGLLAAGSQDIISAASMEAVGITVQADEEKDYVEGIEG